MICRPFGVDGSTGFVVPKTLNLQPNMPSGVGTMIDRAASLQPARAPKQQIPLAPCKGRGRFPAHEEDRLCLPSGSVGSILGKATSTTDYWNTVKQTNKQTNKPNGLSSVLTHSRKKLAPRRLLRYPTASFANASSLLIDMSVSFAAKRGFSS